MIYLIGFEFKRFIKQSKTWVLLGMMFLIACIYLNSSLIKRYRVEGEALGENMEGVANTYLIDNELLETNPDTYYSLKLLKEIGSRVRLESLNQNEKEFNRLVSFVYLILAKERAENLGKLRQRAFKHVTEDMWREVSDGIDYNSISFQNFSTSLEREDYYQLILRAKFHYELYQKDLKAVNYSFIDGSSFAYHYMNKVMPWLLSVFITVMLFDCISSDRENDSIKLLLTQSLSRSRYILSKIISGFIQSCFVLITPMLAITLVYGMLDSFQNINYPVLYLKHGFQTLKPIENFIEFDKVNSGFNLSIGLSLYSGIPKGSGGISPSIGLIPLYRFLFLALLLVLVYILFIVILNVLLSSFIRNKIIGFIISMILIAGGTILGDLNISSMHRNINPLSMNNAIRILSGTYNVTPLGAVTILSICSLLFVFIILLFFRKKDL